jgi:WD40 repeat protein
LQINSGYVLSDGNSGNNYLISSNTAVGTITPATLSLSGFTAQDKVFDGTTIATISHIDYIGRIGTDVLNIISNSINFANKTVGADQLVTLINPILTGADAGNYQLVSSGIFTTLAAITPASLIQWIGTINNDWSNAGNWNQGIVPNNQDVLLNQANGKIVLSGGDYTIKSLISNHHSVDFSGGTLKATGDVVFSGGELSFNGGVLSAPSLTLKDNAILSGAGVVNTTYLANVSGIVSPGHSPGTLVINGNYTQGSAGVLNMELAGLISSFYDKLQVLGTATINGFLNITPIGTYVQTAQVNDKFNLLNASTISGGFSAIETLSGFAYSSEIHNGLYNLITTKTPNLPVVTAINKPIEEAINTNIVTTVPKNNPQNNPLINTLPEFFTAPQPEAKPVIEVARVENNAKPEVVDFVGGDKVTIVTESTMEENIPMVANTPVTLPQVIEENKPPILPTLTIKNSAGRVKSSQLSRNKQFLSLLLEDGTVRIWDFQHGLQRRIQMSDSKQVLTDVGRVNDKGEVLSIASTAGIKAYDVISSSPNASIKANNINHFANADDNSVMLINTGASRLIFWNNQAQKKVWELRYDRGVINNLALSHNNRYGAVLSSQQGSFLLPTNLQLKRLTDAVNIVDLRTGKVIKSLPNMGEQIVQMEFKDNDTLQLGLASGEVMHWSVTGDSQKMVTKLAENITTVDTTADAYSYVLKDGSVKVNNPQGQVVLTLQNKDNPFKDVKLLEAGKKLLTVMANGDLAVWDVQSGKKMLRLFSTLQGWTVMDSFGRFDGTEESLENFTWLANEEGISLDSFSENYYEPGLLASVLQNQDYLNSKSIAVADGVTLPPKVDLQIAEKQQKGDEVAVQFDVYDRGGGIDKIHVYHNGRMLSDNSLLPAPQISEDGNAERRTFTLNVTPIAGKNTLKVTASNTMGIENSSSEVSFDGKSKAYASSLRLLSVGINQYSDKELDLNYSVADAESIVTALKNTAKISAYKGLYNENATKAKILAELKELSQGTAQDALVIYFAGHGVALGKEWYFLPYETKMLPSLEKIVQAGISATELSDIFKNSKIQHILLMVDSCHSGGSMDVFAQLQNGQRYFTRQLSRALGITVVTAAAKDQEAAELKSLGHGLFTYLMAQEIENKDTTKIITAHGVAEAILKSLPVFSKRVLGIVQEPVIYTHGSDFMLTDILKKPSKVSTSDTVPPANTSKKSVQ